MRVKSRAERGLDGKRFIGSGIISNIKEYTTNNQKHRRNEKIDRQHQLVGIQLKNEIELFQSISSLVFITYC